MIIAVDFDGTVVEHRYPEIGKTILFAFETLKALQEKNHRLILWTYRAGKELDEAVEFCRQNGIEFYAINKNYPEEEYVEGEISRKINADIYIDDKNIGGFLGWGKIWELIEGESIELLEEDFKRQNKKSFFKRLFG
jgi:hydroxymethylpyrimidine pyrophosphatase-like HAD family hydrolase